MEVNSWVEGSVWPLGSPMLQASSGNSCRTPNSARTSGQIGLDRGGRAGGGEGSGVGARCKGSAVAKGAGCTLPWAWALQAAPR